MIGGDCFIDQMGDRVARNPGRIHGKFPSDDSVIPVGYSIFRLVLGQRNAAVVIGASG